MDHKNIFITRDLTLQDYFYKNLFTQGYVVEGESLIEFSPVSVEVIPKTDWIFFYSKNAVTFFYQELKEKNLTLSNGAKIAAFGMGTAKRAEDLFKQVDYIGSGKAESTAVSFSTLAKDQSVLFPRAKNSRKSVQQLIQKEVFVQDLIVYDNRPKAKVSCVNSDILVFTSPMNAQTYLRHCAFLEKQIIIAIGASTKKTFVSFGINSVIMPKMPLESALVELILSL